MIELFVWKGGNVGQDISVAEGAFKPPPGFNWGHSSLAVHSGLPAGKEYISWWPGNSLKMGFVQAEPYMPKDEHEDTRLEDGQKPIKLALNGLDETAIKRWWHRRKSSRSAEYRAWGCNCSTTIYMALVAGGSHRYTPLGEGDMPWFGDELCDPEGFLCQYWVWYPLKVLAYAERVRKGLAEAKRKRRK